MTKRTGFFLILTSLIFVGGGFAITLAATGHTEQGIHFAEWGSGGIGTLLVISWFFGVWEPN